MPSICILRRSSLCFLFFFFNDPATTEIYTLSLHDALPIFSDYWIEINRLENDADKLYRRFVARLFDGEFDPLTLMKLKEVADELEAAADAFEDRKSTRLNSSHRCISYAVFCLKKKKKKKDK